MDQFYVLSLSTLSFLILIISILWYTKAGRALPLPPGPRGLPILGYLPFLANGLLKQFTELSHKYGPIYKLQLGNKLCIVISSPSLVKEVVRDKDAIFAYRDVPAAAFAFSYGGNDIAWSKPDSDWRLLRKTFVREMLSHSNLEASYNLRKNEVRKAIEYVYSNNGKLIDIGELIFRTELNVIMNMLWGGTIEGDMRERAVSEFRTIIMKIVDLIGKPNISDFYPFLAGLDIQGVKKEMKSYVQSMDMIFDTVFAEYKKRLSRGIKFEGKDFLQILLGLSEKEDSKMSITKIQLKAILMDFVVAGTDTSATSIEWAMAELINNPKIMAKAQNELRNVVGMYNTMEEFHMPKLKYMEEVIKETLRLHPAVPLLLPRSPAQSSTIGGYTIPQNSRVFINVSSIHRDSSVWDNPTEFKPERFLDDNGKWDFSRNNFEYLPFGSGRRVCAGISLAERMLMYSLGSLVHSFEWILPEGETLDMSERFGIVLRKNTPLLAVPSHRLSNSDLCT